MNEETAPTEQRAEQPIGQSAGCSPKTAIGSATNTDTTQGDDTGTTAPAGVETSTGTGTATDTASHDPEFPEALLTFMKSGWHDLELLPGPRPEAVHHARRRAALSAAFAGETLVIPTGHERVRANDTYHPFRPGSDFIYLTGENQPDAVLIMRPTGSGHDATLYLRPHASRDSEEFFRSRHGELWLGRRPTLAERADELGIETAHLDELERALADCAPGRTRVLRGLDPAVDAGIRAADSDGARDAELAAAIAELKLVKDEWEIAQLRHAIDATVRGFEDVARVLPGDRPVSERLLEGIFGLRARHDGNDVGYGSIVGAGANATILHWVRNDGRTRPGELLLMDMGVEGRYLYTADVTRVLPVSGRFSPTQRRLYELVLASQQAGIEAVKPGVKFSDVHETCMRVLAEGLRDLGILPVSVDEAMSKESMLYRRWTLHGFGHMLGLDVHDCARARKERYREGELGEGYVLTVEPGLYFQPEDELVPEELRGIGIRIEGDTISKLPVYPEPYLVLHATGALEGFDGCNWLNGSAKVSGETIGFGALGTTKRFCAGSDIWVEMKVFAALDAGEASYRIHGGRLFLSRADGPGLILRAA